MKKDQLTNYINNGASLDKNLNMINKKNGYMCSIIGMERTFKPEEIDKINNCIIEYKNKLKANQYIGIWNHDGLVYIDISRHYTNKQDAIKNGIKNKQLAIYDLKNNRDIDLTKKVYILYKYNKIKNDIQFITEFTNVKSMENTLKMNYNTLKSYMIKSIDDPINELLKDKYIIIPENACIRDLI